MRPESFGDGDGLTLVQLQAYEQACVGGMPMVCSDLAARYRAGRDVPRDLEKAGQWEAVARRFP